LWKNLHKKAKRIINILNEKQIIRKYQLWMSGQVWKQRKISNKGGVCYPGDE
jgi:hypothetical protein